MKDRGKIKVELNGLLARVERARTLLHGSEIKMEELQATIDATERYLRRHRKPDDKRKTPPPGH